MNPHQPLRAVTFLMLLTALLNLWGTVDIFAVTIGQDAAVSNQEPTTLAAEPTPAEDKEIPTETIRSQETVTPTQSPTPNPTTTEPPSTGTPSPSPTAEAATPTKGTDLTVTPTVTPTTTPTGTASPSPSPTESGKITTTPSPSPTAPVEASPSPPSSQPPAGDPPVNEGQNQNDQPPSGSSSQDQAPAAAEIKPTTPTAANRVVKKEEEVTKNNQGTIDKINEIMKIPLTVGLREVSMDAYPEEKPMELKEKRQWLLAGVGLIILGTFLADPTLEKAVKQLVQNAGRVLSKKELFGFINRLF